MVAAHNGLFAAGFECPTLARAGVRRRRARTNARSAWSPITENGLFTRGKEKFAHPNVRGGWNVRGGSMFLCAAGALYHGTRETYETYLAAAIWRAGRVPRSTGDTTATLT
ncbi:hypothetical protein SO694_00032391 [Aureococcus anophagefferens]|uniref:Uncharacterized protein n=1 Tax=Aureococcus anophagefferens TaxID=44056 RepID=A0ABR1FKI9_AURAN